MGRIARSVRQFAFTRIGAAAVLRYHRVADLERDPHATAIAPARFREHMEIVRRRFCPIRLEEAVLGIAGRSLPRPAVAVTFDDGYEDNLTEAMPVLEACGVPATVFVTTGYLGIDREFWWDVLERLLLSPGRLPDELSLAIRPAPFRFDLGRSARYSDADAARFSGWNWQTKSDPTLRHTLFRRLSDRLRPLGDVERSAVLNELTNWAGSAPVVRHGYRPLDRHQVAVLGRNELVTIGAHSVTHPVLSKLTREEQGREIFDSKVHLEEIVGRPISAFAYPYGVVGKTVPLVRQAGFTHAVGTNEGLALPGVRRFRLPRLYVGNWEGDELQHRMMWGESV